MTPPGLLPGSYPPSGSETAVLRHVLRRNAGTEEKDATNPLPVRFGRNTPARRRDLVAFTIRAVNELAHKGVCFSYATARSAVTAEKVTADLRLRTPAIVHNGVFIWGAADPQAAGPEPLLPPARLRRSAPPCRPRTCCRLSHTLFRLGRGRVGGRMRALSLLVRPGSWHGRTVSRPARLPRNPQGATRARRRLAGGGAAAVQRENPGGLTGEICYYTCIDRAEKLAPLYERFRDPIYLCF